MSQYGCPTRLNCQSADAWQPNSDIAGLGVLIGFVGTGYLVFALLVVHYLVAYEPELPPPQQTPDDERPSQAANSEHLAANLSVDSPENIVTHTDPMYWESNPIDVNLLAWVRSLAAKLLGFLGASLPLVGQATSEHIDRCFNSCIVAMCDVQIVTGMSILIGGFICLDEHLSALHWQIIIYLAWFSCVTHLSGLTVLRRYFQAHPWEKSLRITLMFILLVILMVALFPSGFFNWKSPRADSSLPQATAASAKTSAACFYSLNCAKKLYQHSLALNCTEVCTDDSGNSFPCHLHPIRYFEEFSCRMLAESSAMQEMIISTVLLLFGFVSRTIKLSNHVSSTIYRRITLPVSAFLLYCFAKVEDVVSAPDTHATSRWHARMLLFEVWRGFMVRPLLAVTIFLSAHINLFNSMLGEVSHQLCYSALGLTLEQLSWLLAILLWGTSKVLSAHYDELFYTNEDEKQKPNEDKNHKPNGGQSTRWEFGQVLPVLLLAAPLVAVLGTFTSAEKSSESIQSRDPLEVPITSLETISSGHDHNPQPGGYTWELTTLSTTGNRSTVPGQHEDGQSHVDTNDAQHSASQNEDNDRRHVFARDYYREALWMPPWIIISFVMIWVYVFFLFWYATDVFLVEDISNSEVAGKMSDSLDYLFNPSNGAFYVTIVSYPVMGHSVILSGLTVDEWTGAPRTSARRFGRSMIFWIWTLAINVTFAIFTHLFVGGGIKEFYNYSTNVPRLLYFSLIIGTLYGLYILACLTHLATSWIKLVAGRTPRADIRTLR